MLRCLYGEFIPSYFLLSNCSNLVYTNNPFFNNELNEFDELLRVVIRLIR